jgi:hypothetical protein
MGSKSKASIKNLKSKKKTAIRSTSKKKKAQKKMT